MMSILEDYDHDNMPLADLDEEFLEINNLGDELLTLSETCSAIKSYGLNQTTMSLMKTTGLLSGTSLEAIAIESIGTHGSSDPETMMALESRVDKIKEKTPKMSAKIVSLFKKTGSGVSSIISSLWDKIKTAFKKAKDKVFSAADATKKYAKVHPYKTIALAVAALVAVVGLVTFTSGSLTTIKDTKSLVAFNKQLAGAITKIKWPFGKITTTLSKHGTKIAVAVANIGAIAGAATLLKLGWNKLSAENVMTHLENAEDALTNSWPTIQGKSLSILEDTTTMAKGLTRAATTGYHASQGSNPDVPTSRKISFGITGALISTFIVGVISIVYTLYHLIRVIVIGVMKLCPATFNKLSGASDSAPAQNQYV
jgi:hypothetical protein